MAFWKHPLQQYGIFVTPIQQNDIFETPIQQNGIFETPYTKNSIFETPYTTFIFPCWPGPPIQKRPKCDPLYTKWPEFDPLYKNAQNFAPYTKISRNWPPYKKLTKFDPIQFFTPLLEGQHLKAQGRRCNKKFAINIQLNKCRSHENTKKIGKIVQF